MKPTIAAATFAVLTALLFPGVGYAADWTWPVRGEVITPYRNGDDPYAVGQHRGIDIGAAAGERVVAAAAGTVTFAGVAGSSGLTVSVRTADGRFDTSYLHLAGTAVEDGDTVRAGDSLGAVGTSGRRSAERPHLHFGVREAGARLAYRDPLDFLGTPPPRGEPREPAPAPAPVGAPAEPSGEPAEPRGAPAVTAPAPAPVPHGSPAAHPVPPASPGHTPRPAAHPRPFPGADPLAPRPTHRRASAPAAAHASALDDLRARASASAVPGQETPEADRAVATSPPPLGTGPAVVERPTPDAPSQAAEPGARPVGRPGADPASGGIDPGWLVACIGLLLVATALGRSATAPRAGRGASGRPLRRAGSLSARVARP